MRHAKTSIAAMMLIAAGSMALLALAAEPETGKTGVVVGKVLDEAGKAAPDCIVTLAQDSQKMRNPLDATTDRDGKFMMSKVPEGDYNLNVRSKDLKFKAIKSLSVSAGEVLDIGELKLKRVPPR